MLPTTLVHLITYWISLFSGIHDTEPRSLESQGSSLTVQLRYQHAVSDLSRNVFANAPPQDSYISQLDTHTVKTRRMKVYKPQSDEAFAHARLRSLRFSESEIVKWKEEDVIVPDVEDRETLQVLAKMTYNAYLDKGEASWYDLGNEWTTSYPFGWEPDADGFRGYVFATRDNSTVIVSIKGTTVAGLLGGSGPTVKKDKFNDNLLFSCCCARIDWTWTTVCDCYSNGWKCDIDCLQRSLVDDSLFYSVGTYLYNNLSYIYPESNIWVIGHSLGGSLASLLGATFGVPVVTFEAPGEKMAAGRLHLPSPPSLHHITHLYHTADPIAMGTCNGILSSCALGGYALESRCHLGKTILYDTVSNLSWPVDVRTHTIATVIERLLSEPWQAAEEVGRQVPKALAEDECIECYSWEFGNYKNITMLDKF